MASMQRFLVANADAMAEINYRTGYPKSPDGFEN